MKNKNIFCIAAIVCTVIFISLYFLTRNADEPAAVYDSYAAAPITGFVTMAPKVYKAYVTGSVLYPGVYEFEDGARVEDLIALAGGAAEDADIAAINLAQRVKDEQRVYVPAMGANPAPETASSADGIIDINTATAAEFVTLPGIGEKTAGAVIEYREKNGHFSSVDELLNVFGIGPAMLDRIRDKVKI